ncbi:MAG TPA: nuclear transport factor 2 family protein [Acidimicrobiales bacterium]|jgi:ketosteroid isomerase-like protein|nr:nuclear transport factor 2 family protein [Acidimicrobiales bacterium]
MGSNAEVAWSFFELLGRGRIDEALAVLDDDGTWWHVRTRRAYPMRRHKRQLARAWSIVPLQFTRFRTVEDGDTVVLELASHAQLPGGGAYDNRYVYVVTMGAGTLLHVREYSDTAYGDRVLTPEIQALFAEAAAESAAAEEAEAESDGGG